MAVFSTAPAATERRRQRRLQEAAQQGLHLLHRRLHRLRDRAGHPRAVGLNREWIGFIFLMATIGLYAGIGIMSRTTDAAEYYVAGRRVPAVYNGMATGADWMSAASFIGMAGTLYLTGYGGLAFIMGWTGGYCLVALFLAPYLRKFGQFTIPDFLGERYGGNLPRFIGIVAAILCSFTYVVAQIYGVGIITTRLTGVAFELGIFLGLGGILVCSFLGGMRAVTWTQVAQYIILILAYMIPVVWLAVKQTGVPIPQAIYGYQLEKVSKRGDELRKDPKELEVVAIFKARADEFDAKLKNIPTRAGCRQGGGREEGGRPQGRQRHGLASGGRREGAGRRAQGRRCRQGCLDQGQGGEPDDRAKPLGGMPHHAQVFAGDPNGDAGGAEDVRRVAAQLPGADLLPDGGDGRAAAHPDALLHDAQREGGAGLGDLVAVLHLPAVLHGAGPGGAGRSTRCSTTLVGTPFDKLPVWIANWKRVDPALLSVVDINKDGILQLDGDEDRRRHRRAGDAGNRRPAVRDLGPGGGRRPGRGAVHGRRPAADDRQRAEPRPVLQDDRPECLHGTAGDAVEDAAAGRGPGRGRRGVAETGGHPVPGIGGVLVRRGGFLPGAGAGHLLEAGHRHCRLAGHGGRPGHHASTTW